MDMVQKNDCYQAWIKTGNDIEKSLIKIHQSRWFKQLEPSSNRLLDWFRLAHNDFYISEQLKLKSQWIDPWLYMHNTAYKVSIDTVFRMLKCNQHHLKHLLMKWLKQWFNKIKVSCFDWSNVMMMNEAFDKPIHMLSGHVSQEMAESCKQAGVQLIYTKTMLLPQIKGFK